MIRKLASLLFLIGLSAALLAVTKTVIAQGDANIESKFTKRRGPTCC